MPRSDLAYLQILTEMHLPVSVVDVNSKYKSLSGGVVLLLLAAIVVIHCGNPPAVSYLYYV